MAKKVKTMLQGAMITVSVFFITGCNGGGGLAALGLGSLFGAGGGGGGGGIGDLVQGGGGGGASTFTNPEPASLLLMGSGMAAMAYFKARKKS